MQSLDDIWKINVKGWKKIRGSFSGRASCHPFFLEDEGALLVVGGVDKNKELQINVEVVQFNSDKTSIEKNYSLGPGGRWDPRISEKAFYFQNLATVVMAFQRDSRKLKDHTEILMQTVVPRNYEDSSIDELCKSTIDLILSVGAGNLTFQAKADIKLILAYAIKMVENEENLLEIEGEVKLYGDIHGYLDGLMKLWDAFGSPLPGSKNQDIHPFNYIFLGDFVDRGPNSLETICLLVCLKVLNPKRVYLVRGNHEEDLDYFNTPEDNFRNLKKTDNTLYNQFMEFFDRLPMAAVINQRVN